MNMDADTEVVYEPRDTESRNLLAEFRSRAEALAVVRDAIQHHGSESVSAWVLGRTDDASLAEPLIEGCQLAGEARSLMNVRTS